MTPAAQAHFQIGDVIDIAGVYADGTHAPNEGPIDATKPVKLWRVRYVGLEGVRLQPLNADKSVDFFNDACGEYWIRSSGFSDGL